jgi:hypothetical protein
MKSATDKDQSAEEFFYNRGFKPCFHDGLCSHHTYLVVACKEARAYNCIGIRNVGRYFRVHAYPSFEFFGLTDIDSYGPKEDVNGISYEGVHFNQQQIIAMLTTLQEDDLVKVAPLDQIFSVVDQGYDPESADSANEQVSEDD